jgi:GNAT superfamily N-acetyltransferase
MEVRPVRPDEWEHWRAFRLRALATDPRAFGAFLAEEEAQPEAWWIDRVTPTPTNIRFVAEEAGAWLGTCGLGVKEGEPEVWGMWVAPEGRGRGVGQLLLRAAEERARAQGATTLTLWVNLEQSAAHALYRRAGFADEGAPWQGTRDPTRRYQKMRKPL